MKIRHLLATLAFTSVLFVSACSTAENKPEPTATLESPTPAPGSYEGEPRTYQELLAAVQGADPSSSWVENTIQKHWISGAEFAMDSKTRCGLQVFPSFQDAVDNDDGSYYDYWTTLGLYGQLGVVLLDNGTCVEKLSEVIRFPGFPSPDQDYTVLTASKENIKDCIERKSACLLDAGEKLPDRDLSSFNVTSTELEELSSAGFCILLYPSSDIGGRDSCEIEDPNGEFEIVSHITQDSSDLDVLRFAAKAPSKTDGLGKYLIYGDGWVMFIYESTEDHKKLFLDINKVIKGALVTRY